MALIERVHWILSTTAGFDLYIDHHNSIFLSDPVAVVPNISQTSLRKVLRWAIRLSAYIYTCVQIKGVDNVWADLPGRCFAPVVAPRLEQVPVLPSSFSVDYDWPSLNKAGTAQQRSDAQRTPNFVFQDRLWRGPSKSFWTFDSCLDLPLCLCFAAHRGSRGHCGEASTLASLRSDFFWSTMTIDLSTFV